MRVARRDQYPFYGEGNYSSRIFQIPFAETTMRALDEHFDLHEHHRARRAHHFGVGLDELAELHGADELGIELDGSVALDAGRLARRHRHGLIGEASSACRRADCRRG